MKKVLTTVVVLFICLSVAGQEKEVEQNYKSEIGIVFSDLLNGSFTLKYERLVGQHISIGLNLGYKGDKGIIRLSGLDTDHIQTNDLTYSGFKFIPEVRYYIKKTQLNAMDGFYFGAYLKHSNFKSDLDGTYINDAEENFDIKFDGKFNVTSIGLEVGYKYRVSNRLVIDFLIAGPGAGFHSYTLTKQQSLPDEFYDDLNEALDSYSILDLIDADFQFNENKAKTSFSGLAFRYGITVGYSF